MHSTTEDVLYSFLVILCSVLCWKYFIYLRSYWNFPQKRFDFDFMWKLFTGKFPKDSEFPDFLFKLMEEHYTLNQKNGLFLAWFFQPLVFILCEEYAKKILNDESMNEKPLFNKLLEDVIGRGSVTLGGSEWKKRKRFLGPIFRLDAVRCKIPIFNHIAKDFVRELGEASSESDVDITYFLKMFTCKAFCETTFGINTSNKKYDQLFHDAEENIDRLEFYTVYRFPRPWLYWKRFQVLFSAGREIQKSSRELLNFIKYMVDEMLNSTSSSLLNGLDERKCLSRVLMEQHRTDPSFTMDDLHEEVRTLFIAGHDTVTFSMLWCLFMLAIHPEIQEKAFEEIESIVGDMDADLTSSDINCMSYLDSVIKESQRLYPVIPLVGRQATKDVQCGTYKIPKDTCIVIPIFSLQRDPNNFPDPEKFDPERFYRKSLKNPWAFIPFAEGTRGCIGKMYAMMEMKIFLAHIIRNFEITTTQKREDIVINWKITMLPVTPIRMKFTRRQ